jgi:secreted trypsin-like serine protease
MYVIYGLLLVFVFNSIVFINEIKSEFRIVGGVKALKGEFPHQALLVRKGYLMCSTSLIDHKWVVTAAHCVTINKGAKDVPEITNVIKFLFLKIRYNKPSMIL